MSIFSTRVVEKIDPPVKAWSFSRLDTFETCAYRIQLGVVERIKPPRGEAGDRGIALHTDCEKFIRSEVDEIPEGILGCHDILQLARGEWADETLLTQVENRWAFDKNWGDADFFKDPNCWARIILDMLTINGKVATIRDWKSGKFANNALKHRQQGQLYAVATLLKFPYLDRLDIEFHYIDHDKVRKWSYTPAEIAILQAGWTERGNNLTTATEFPANNAAWNCGYCDFGVNGDCVFDFYADRRDEDGKPIRTKK